MSRKILISGLSILASLGIVTAATYAYFNDTNSSTANAFTAGSLDLQLDDTNEPLSSASVSASLGGTGLAPGGSVSGYISVHNNGSIPMAEVVFGADQTAGADTPNLADVLNLTVLTGSDTSCSTDSVDRTGTIATAVGNGLSPLTLSELISVNYDALPGLAASGTYYVCMTATMQSTAGNEYQGDTATVDFIFRGNQDASQT